MQKGVFCVEKDEKGRGKTECERWERERLENENDKDGISFS